MPKHRNHAIDYVEFEATDLVRVKEFYFQAFGWQFTDWGEGYTSFEDGALAGGFSRVDEVERGGPLVVLYANELESTRDSVTSAGGRVVRDIFEFPGGRRFHFTDPAGNELAVWSE